MLSYRRNTPLGIIKESRRLSHRMELLIVTLAHTLSGRDADVLARVRLIADTVRNAPGLISSASRFYRGRKDSYYLALTTWEDEESWFRAQEQYNPRQLLLEGSAHLLTAPPEQWSMHYLWGYTRPTAKPILAAAHIATIRSGQVDATQQGWIQELRHQASQPVLAFAFLARGSHEAAQPAKASPASSTPSSPHGSVFLNLLSWASEAEREEFYADGNYQAINKMVNSVGKMRVFSLEPM